jgi:hypothetical protein
MNFRNVTPFPAFLHREAISGDRIAAAVIVRATFEIGTPCRPSYAQPWMVLPTAWEGPAGPMESDALFDREGCDLLLFGSCEACLEFTYDKTRYYGGGAPRIYETRPKCSTCSTLSCGRPN